MAAPLLELDGVTLQYKTAQHLVTATYRVSFKVYRADRFVLLGPSGCGKSSLLKGIAGFRETGGGRRAAEWPRRGGSGAGPDDGVSGIRSVDAVANHPAERLFPMRASGRYARREAADRASAYLDKVGLAKFTDVYPHMLSGGMKQRAAIARAMAMEPDVLLMDEPFAALDALTRRKMQDELLQLWDDVRFTVLFRHAFDRGSHHRRKPDRGALAAPGAGEGRAERRPARQHRRQRLYRVARSHPQHAFRRARRSGSMSRMSAVQAIDKILPPLRAEVIYDTKIHAAEIGEVERPLSRWERIRI